MADFLSKFFSDLEPLQIFGLVVVVLAIAYLLYVVFAYAKKNNLDRLVYVELIAIVIVFALSFTNLPGYKYYLLAAVAILLVINSSIFIQDFRRYLFRKSWRRHAVGFGTDTLGREELHKASADIVRACQHLSKSNTGALILIVDNISEGIVESGTKISAEVTSELLETIFFPNTPLHDGAVVIAANMVVAAGCYLPLTQSLNLPREFGTRHRAAIGISEAMPSITAIVVSEETGIISAMHDGKVKRYLDADSLKRVLDYALRLLDDSEEEKIWGKEIEA